MSLNLIAGFAALGGAVLGGVAGAFVGSQVEKKPLAYVTGGYVLVGAALGAIVGASLPSPTPEATASVNVAKGV